MKRRKNGSERLKEREDGVEVEERLMAGLVRRVQDVRFEHHDPDPDALMGVADVAQAQRSNIHEERGNENSCFVGDVRRCICGCGAI